MIVFHGSIEIVKSPDVLHSYRSDCFYYAEGN
jgi:hypothetical protein